jgi:hypothetical protein
MIRVVSTIVVVTARPKAAARADELPKPNMGLRGGRRARTLPPSRVAGLVRNAVAGGH